MGFFHNTIAHLKIKKKQKNTENNQDPSATDSIIGFNLQTQHCQHTKNRPNFNQLHFDPDYQWHFFGFKDLYTKLSS